MSERPDIEALRERVLDGLDHSDFHERDAEEALGSLAAIAREAEAREKALREALEEIDAQATEFTLPAAEIARTALAKLLEEEK